MACAPLNEGSSAGCRLSTRSGKASQHDGRHLAHVARHDHVLRAGFLQRGHDLRVGRLGVGVFFAVHDQRGDAGGVRALDAVGIGTRRDRLHHLDGQPLRRLIKDGLEIRAAAGEQHADLQLFRTRDSLSSSGAQPAPRIRTDATSIRAGGEASPRSRQASPSTQGERERERERGAGAHPSSVGGCRAIMFR